MIVPHTVDYTDKDFDALRLRLRNLVSSVFPTWTDFNVTDFGNILLELFANVGDVLTFYQDNQALQSRITTATQRRALLGLVKLIGYTPNTATAATVDVVLGLPSVTAGDVVFPAGSFVQTREVTAPIRYQLTEEVTIPAGALSAPGKAENSEPRVVAFVSNGLPNQSFVLPALPYIDSSLSVIAANGVFEQVVNFLESGPNDRHFAVAVDQNDRATVRFGNGVNGLIPTGGIAGSYKTGGGAAGRVEAGQLQVLPGSWTDAFGQSVTPTVTNPEPSSGGTDRQTVAQIKERGPATLRVLRRTVSREDYEINALRLSDVARALMLTSNEDATIAENRGELYIVPVGGGAPSQALKDAVKEQFTIHYPKTITFDLDIFAPVYRVLPIYVVVFFRAGANRPATAAAIRAALAAFFAPQLADGTTNELIDFGAKITDGDGNIVGELALSDLMNAVRDVAGVRKIGDTAGDFLVDGEHADVELAAKAFPKLGEVTIIDGDTGAEL